MPTRNASGLAAKTEADESLVEREREYHNMRFSEETRDAQDKYYYAIQDCDARYGELLATHAKGAVVLDYGCALGEWAMQLAPVAAEVHGIDISDVAIASAKVEAARRGLGNTRFAVMDAHHTDYPDNHFDLIFGIGIIHHLDTELSLKEVARLLKPGGVAIFREPLGVNPAINAYRTLTPQARTEDEHPLVVRDKEIADRLFGQKTWTFYGLLTLASVPLRRSALGRPAYRALATLDALLLRVPGLKWLGWCALMELRK
jgi:2-polyprenyl-3-methyl-5-hydroxy-6-metoxy-1,4-benzoquinol methylase